MAVINSNEKKTGRFWWGVMIGFLAGFLAAWLSIWATYISLERGHRAREAELQQIKRILFYGDDILQQRREIFDWNRQTRLPAPVVIEPGEEQ